MQHLHRICIPVCLYLNCFTLTGLSQNNLIQENKSSYYYNGIDLNITNILIWTRLRKTHSGWVSQPRPGLRYCKRNCSCLTFSLIHQYKASSSKLLKHLKKHTPTINLLVFQLLTWAISTSAGCCLTCVHDNGKHKRKKLLVGEKTQANKKKYLTPQTHLQQAQRLAGGTSLTSRGSCF